MRRGTFLLCQQFALIIVPVHFQPCQPALFQLGGRGRCFHCRTPRSSRPDTAISASAGRSAERCAFITGTGARGEANSVQSLLKSARVGLGGLGGLVLGLFGWCVWVSPSMGSSVAALKGRMVSNPGDTEFSFRLALLKALRFVCLDPVSGEKPGSC